MKSIALLLCLGAARAADLDVGQEADVSIAKDGGCMKKVLAKGSGDERPQIGNEVTVHYTGTLLDGTKFDSSVDRGDPFKFKLGVGQVIKGWDEGVASMRKGEKAILTCTPEYAYGAAGSPPTIPANSTLKFEVELFSWTNDNDLYKDGGIVLAKTLKKADGYTFAKERDEVKVTYSVAASDADVVGGGDTIVPSTEAEFVVKDAPFDGMRALLAKIKEGDSGIYKMKNVPGGRQYCAGLPGCSISSFCSNSDSSGSTPCFAAYDDTSGARTALSSSGSTSFATANAASTTSSCLAGEASEPPAGPCSLSSAGVRTRAKGNWSQPTHASGWHRPASSAAAL